MNKSTRKAFRGAAALLLASVLLAIVGLCGYSEASGTPLGGAGVRRAKGRAPHLATGGAFRISSGSALLAAAPLRSAGEWPKFCPRDSWMERAPGDISELTEIEFVSDHEPPADFLFSWPADAEGTGSITAFFLPEGRVVISSSADGISLPEDCKSMFAELASLRSVRFGIPADLSRTESLRQMFQYDYELEEIEFNFINADSVREAPGMFEGCWALRELDLSWLGCGQMFDTIRMFSECTSLRTVTVDPDRWRAGEGFFSEDMFSGDNCLHNYCGDDGGLYAVPDDGRNEGYLTPSREIPGRWLDVRSLSSAGGLPADGPFEYVLTVSGLSPGEAVRSGSGEVYRAGSDGSVDIAITLDGSPAAERDSFRGISFIMPFDDPGEAVYSGGRYSDDELRPLLAAAAKEPENYSVHLSFFPELPADADGEIFRDRPVFRLSLGEVFVSEEDGTLSADMSAEKGLYFIPIRLSCGDGGMSFSAGFGDMWTLTMEELRESSPCIGIEIARKESDACFLLPEGASFSLRESDAAGCDSSLAVMRDGELCFESFKAFDEEQGSAGAASTIFTADGYYRAVFTNSRELPPMTGPIIVSKRDAGDGSPLGGAEFELRGADGELIGVGVSDAFGTLEFPNLQDGDYTLTETAAPAGYIGGMAFTVSVEGGAAVSVEACGEPGSSGAGYSVIDGGIVTVFNERIPQAELPATGGPGLGAYALISAAWLIGIYLKRF